MRIPGGFLAPSAAMPAADADQSLPDATVLEPAAMEGLCRLVEQHLSSLESVQATISRPLSPDSEYAGRSIRDCTCPLKYFWLSNREWQSLLHTNEIITLFAHVLLVCFYLNP